jgi:putative transposase
VPPEFVESGAVFFLTICTTPRRVNQLASAQAWAELSAAAMYYHAKGRWQVRLLLAMPDHIHALASFPATESISRVITAWKHYLHHQYGIAWQRDYFDHRLRNHESLSEKAAYIRQNPVRAGLVQTADAWPYVWTPETAATPS